MSGCPLLCLFLKLIPRTRLSLYPFTQFCICSSRFCRLYKTLGQVMRLISLLLSFILAEVAFTLVVNLQGNVSSTSCRVAALLLHYFVLELFIWLLIFGLTLHQTLKARQQRQEHNSMAVSAFALGQQVEKNNLRRIADKLN